MKSTYKRLGDYIRQVDVRNKGLITSNLLGINIDKFFMPSVANIIGTDLSNYKLITKNQFAFNPMHVGRDERMPIALYLENKKAIVSPAYFVFEIIGDELLSKYLMLWFRRPEFDRECWFYTDASVRGGITWEDFCEMRIPVPSIEEQQKIVDVYETIERRIALKRKINENLEAQAQAIYNKTFVEDIDYSTLPDGWHFSALKDVAELSAGGDRPLVFSDVQTEVCSIPIFSNGIENEGLYGFTDKAKISEESVTVSARGTVGYVFLREKPYVPIVRLISVIPDQKYLTAKYLYFALTAIDFQSTGTSQQQITVPDFAKCQVLIPSHTHMTNFMNKINPIFAIKNKNKSEMRNLTKLLEIFLTKLTSC